LHAEGRGFESHHPLSRTRWKRRVSWLFRREGGWAKLGSASEPRSSANAKSSLDGAILLAILPGCPDEQPHDSGESADADCGDHYPKERAHRGNKYVRCS